MDFKVEQKWLDKFGYLDRYASHEYYGGPHPGSILKNEAAKAFATSNCWLLVLQMPTVNGLDMSAPNLE